MDIGKNIKTIRKEKKITQQELAEEIGISRSYLGDLENNRYNPSTKTLELLAQKLNVTMLYLTTGKKSLEDLNESEYSAYKEYSPESTEGSKEESLLDKELREDLLQLADSDLTFIENQLLGNLIWYLQTSDEMGLAQLLIIINRLNKNRDEYKDCSQEELAAKIDEETAYFKEVLKRRYGYEGD